MFLGGDKFQNNPGNNRILKCHECGDTNLRYVGADRIVQSTAEEPDFKSAATYICGNGHKTFGGVDDWEIWGQTDVLQTPAVDSHCGSLNCDLPESIYVNFDGIIGVQARESCGGLVHEDMKSRVRSQYAICGPCCDITQTSDPRNHPQGIYSPNNDPWSISCGDSIYAGVCALSDDVSDLSSFTCGSTVTPIYTTCLGVQTLAGYDITSRWHHSSPNTAGSCTSTPPGYNVGNNPYAPGCDIDIQADLNTLNINPFDADYPEKYRETGPAFITPVSSSSGSSWGNLGWSIVFFSEEKACIRYTNPCIGPSAGVDAIAKRWIYVVKRVHPTATATSNSGFVWVSSSEGINPALHPYTKTCGSPSCDVSPDGPPPASFCTNGNSTGACSNCNNSVGPIAYRVKGGRDQRHFWPNRVPYYPETLSGDSYPNTILKQKIKGVPGSFPEYGECECTDGSISCGDFPVWPSYCNKEINYPSCLEAGPRKCKDEDARWRVDCKDPQDFFTVTLLNNGLNVSLLDYRYSLYITTPPADLDNPEGGVEITFNPVFSFDASEGSSYDKWNFIESPNPICYGLARPGYVKYYGDPQGAWENSASSEFLPNAGAIGVREARLEQLFPTKKQNIEQPHCTRRVRNPQLAPAIPFYMVNTSDVSEQTIILDRYYNTDYLWDERPYKIGNSDNQSLIRPSGDVGSTDLAYFPHPFTANSGSLTEPEIVAIIHSESGTGAQIAFQTIPMSYDAYGSDINNKNVYIDPPQELQAPYRIGTTTGQCEFKTRKVVHGYSVMYPLRDDPIWTESSNNYGAYTYIENSENTDTNIDTTADERPDLSDQPYYEYPVLIPGSGYQLGDKIEFRCWKSLNDLKEKEKGFLGIPKDKYNEFPNGEECVETVIATATVTELNNERIAPTKIGEIWATVNIEGDDYQRQATDIYMAVDMGIVDKTRYNETYGVTNVVLATTQKSNPWKVGDRFYVRFVDTNTINNEPPVEITRMQIEVTGYDYDTGAITSWEIREPGEYYKIVGNNGIRWYNFDEETIFVGNCPCTFDICDDECSGCASKTAYNYTKNVRVQCDPEEPDCSPDGYKNIQVDETRKLEALAQGFNPNDPSDTIEYPFGFPAFPHAGCVTNPEILDDEIPPEPIPLWCPPSYSTTSCESNCRYVARWFQSGPSLGWVLKDHCEHNCACAGVSSTPAYYGDNESADCNCSIQINGGPWITGPVAGRNDSFHCWPITPTWEFPGKSGNYAYSCCYGNPVVEGYRAGIAGNIVYPPLRPQYEAVWQPNTSGFLAGIGTYAPEAYTDDDKKAVQDAFLSLEGCNPLQLDRFGRSRKYPPRAFGKAPCRKIDNSTDPVPSAAQRLQERPLDNYCRAYGFYQQIQPACDISYRGEYIMRTAYKEAIDLETGNFTDGDCDPAFVPAGFTGSNAHKFTGCNPIISNLTIDLKHGEVQFDITAGAPISQRELFPELLPPPQVGPDGFLEVRANSWNRPSVDEEYNSNRYFDYVFGEPNRYAMQIEAALPENQDESDVDAAKIYTNVLKNSPLLYIQDLEGNDYAAYGDIYNQKVFDLPDPRNATRLNVEFGDSYAPPQYSQGFIPLPSSVIGTDLRIQCPYPWENIAKTTNISSIPTASGLTTEVDKNYFYYSAFKNNSAEFVVDKISQARSGCLDQLLIYDPNNSPIPNINYVGLSDYGSVVNSTSTWLNSEFLDENGTGTRQYIVFRAFADPFVDAEIFTPIDFTNVVFDFYATWVQREERAMTLLEALLSDTHRQIFSNMIFEGASNEKLKYCTRMECLYVNVEVDQGTEVGLTEDGSSQRLFVEDRCEYRDKGGRVESIKVLNPGDGYAFEIEERVPMSGVLGGIPGCNIPYILGVSSNIRRRETYKIDEIINGDIVDTVGGHNVGEVYELRFDDTDFAGANVVYEKVPKVMVTNISGGGGFIIELELIEKGEFYKYVKTGEHRAYPIAMILNNYWDHPNAPQNFGRHAKFRPVVGVDPRDPDTYGKVKRVDIEFKGIEYVQPGKYWYIDTKAGEYDNYGNNLNGLDIQHLVDPCKYVIYGDGMNADQIEDYLGWLGNPNLDYDLRFPERQAYYQETETPSGMQKVGDKFQRSIKYYFRTNHYQEPTMWEKMARPWETVMISGDCPIHHDRSNPYGNPGGLLNKTYDMALVEEVNTWNDRPVIGNCPTSLCNNIIDYDDIACAGSGTNVSPNNEYIQNCGKPCPIHTAYDAHRFPVGHTSVHTHSVFAQPAPYLWGCHERIAIDTTFDKYLWCYGISYGDDAYGGNLQTAGFMIYPNINNPKDRCSNAVYSLYGEFGKWRSDNQTNQTAFRSKVITYKMQDPITMTISYRSKRNEHGNVVIAGPPNEYESNCEEPVPSSICPECE
jgi:hypothetical protein